MYSVDLYRRIRLACHHEGLSQREAARRFGVDRKTVAKMLAHGVPPGYRRSRPPVRPKLDPFTGIIDRIIEEDRLVHRKQRHTAKRIFDRLREEHGFTGGHTIVKDYVRERRRRRREMFVPLAHAPGHAQVDWRDMWPEITPFGQGLWGEFVWGGKLDPEDAGTYGIGAYHVLPTSVFARYVRIELDDQDNPDGYLEAGRLIVSPAWQPTRNLTYGWTLRHIDESRRVRSRGGQLYVDLAPKRRRLEFTIPHLSEDEMFSRAYELDRDKGVGGDLLVIVDPDKPAHLHRQAIYGALAEVTGIENPSFQRVRHQNIRDC